MVMIILGLVALGLCFGSFVNALVWRVHRQANLKRSVTKKTKNSLAVQDKYSIRHGRSMCVHCEHQLSGRDLIPVVSWLLLRGKCRYCKKEISWQYPVVEVITALLFVSSYFFWPFDMSGLEYGVFGVWLGLLVGFMALVVYDLRWMLLPNRIVFPLYGLGALFGILRLVQSEDFVVSLARLVAAVFIGGGIFYILFQASKGKWIGGGDVKLGFLLGILCEGPDKALLMLFLASLLGTFASIPMLAKSKGKKAAKIPFGPFLIAATIVVVLFGERIIEYYLKFTFSSNI